MRGEDVLRTSRLCGGLGITPACAGKTNIQQEMTLLKEDHPRMRGEDADQYSPFGPSRGSPPHARGRPRNVIQGSEGSGITPACAGKTNWRSWWGSITSDHPRMRGEDPMTTAYDMGIVGSPPHARGRLDPRVR